MVLIIHCGAIQVVTVISDSYCKLIVFWQLIQVWQRANTAEQALKENK